MRKKQTSIITLLRFLQRLPFSGCVFLVIGFIGGSLFYESQFPTVFSANSPKPILTVCFSPQGNCEMLILKTIESARSEILVQTFSFTSLPITNALIEAKNRGVEIKVLFDKGQLKEKYSRIQDLKKAGIPTYIDRVAGLSHNKVMIVDREILLTGSYNFTNAANKKNAENLLLIKDPELALVYRSNWMSRFNERENG